MYKKINILHISPTDIRYDGRILKELNSLSKLSHFNLLAFGVEDNEGQIYEPDDDIDIKTFKLVTRKLNIFPRPIKYFINFIEAFLRMILPGIYSNPKIIHCHDTLFLPIALVIKLFCKSQLIYDAHELESDKAGQSRVLSAYTLLIEKISWKYIDLFISVSPSIINWYNETLGVKESLLILNAPQIDDKHVVTKNDYLRKRFNIPSNHKIFLYLGIICKKGRGIDYFLEAFKRDGVESHLVFIGYGDYVNEIKKLEGIFSKIHYHEAVPYTKIVEISQSADVGLCLIEAISKSTYYSLPNKLFEYAFSNLYVLASNFPDIKRVVDKYNLGSCCSIDVDEIYTMIKIIEKMETLVNNKNDKLYEISWPYQEKKLMETYQKLLKNK